MNSVTGRVVASPSNLGIPNILVVLFDVDPDGKPAEVIKGLPATAEAGREAAAGFASPRNELGFLGDRIGSVLTSADGAFTISYENEEFRTATPEEARPDLWLLVLSPERAGKSVRDLLLFASPDIRQNAGRSEAYLVQIDEGVLKEKGIAIPQPPPSDVAARIDAYRQRSDDAQRLDDAVLSVQRAKIEARQSDIAQRKELLRTILAPPPPPAAAANLATLVTEADRVADKLAPHIATEAERVNTALALQSQQRKGIEITVLLNDDDRGAFGIDPTADGTTILDAAQSSSIRARMNGAGADNLLLTSDNPILKACLRSTTDTVHAKEALGLAKPPAPVDPPGDGTGDGALTVNDILTLVRRRLQQQRNVAQQPGTRADAGSVDASVGNFNLKRGPAELPSFYDFRTLQIPFRHVWQQLVDDAPATLAAEAVTHAADLGYAVDLGKIRNVRGLLSEFTTNIATRTSPPQAVVATFDITREEWNACDGTQQQKLESLTLAIQKANEGLIYDADGSYTVSVGWPLGTSAPVRVPPGYRKVSPAMAEQFAQSQREQGELLLDYVRYNNDRSFHKILADLDQALRAKYVFTVFGADESAKAVNFGLLNTYRQKWEPTAYQVGDLVKSIPLAPKEERKYAFKTTFTRKRSEKEARKNNSSLQQQQNTTSRAEEEIVAKAQSKSEFKLNAEANYSKWKVSSSIGLDAQKESQQNKKDFRESVLQATQEFKEERSVEIDSEETYGTETNDSGTISNPNDELAVTYLFYELQKRFKVSEQLYRTLPVVLVAQPVPGPNEITEAWIIANDWVLNRSLLDDSFRPALEYIARRNVGDDFAVRELRKNLRAQRQLVESLKRELSTLRKETDNRYIALQAAIDKRIGEETDRETDSFWDNVGEFFGGDKESPEGAKSREMAAKDAHGFALDKAEKLSLAVQREVSTLHQLTGDYNKAMREQLDRKTMVVRLKTHLKNNILHYMQAIWSMESPDQRFMRLFDTEVPGSNSMGSCSARWRTGPRPTSSPSSATRRRARSCTAPGSRRLSSLARPSASSTSPTWTRCSATTATMRCSR